MEVLSRQVSNSMLIIGIHVRLNIDMSVRAISYSLYIHAGMEVMSLNGISFDERSCCVVISVRAMYVGLLKAFFGYIW